MISRQNLLLVTAAAVVVAAGLGPSARAGDSADEADVEFSLGALQYSKGEFQSALGHFLGSNRLAPNRNTLFNVARAYEQMGRYPDAFRYYESALDGQTNAGVAAAIRDALTRIRPHVAVVSVRTNPPGARLFIDRKDLGARGQSPGRFGLAPGRYRVIAELDGYDDAVSAEVEVGAGTETPVELRLEEILGTLVLRGEVGAEIRVDAENAPLAGVVPGEVRVVPGRHILFFGKPGFNGEERVVEARPRARVPLTVALKPKTGTLVVNADEPGASVLVDGTLAGVTPAVITLPTGTHELVIAKPGFRSIQQRLSIEADAQRRVDLELVSDQRVEAASRTSESVEEAPGSVSIITAGELRAMAYPNVLEAVRGQRGVFVSDDHANPTIGVRGFGRLGDYGSHTLILLDGQPMVDNWSVGSFPGYEGRADIDDIERIEIVRGPGSALYGTGAFAGVINLVSRPRGEPGAVEIGSSVVDTNLARGRIRATVSLGNDAGAWVSASVAHGAGTAYSFPAYAGDMAPNLNGTVKGADGLNAGTTTGRFWWKNLSVQWLLNSTDRQTPTGQYGSILGDPRAVNRNTRGMMEARYEPQVSSVIQLLSRAHVNYYKYTGWDPYYPDLGGLDHSTFEGVWTGLEQRVVITPARGLRVTVGGEAQFHVKAEQADFNELGVVTTPSSRPYQVGAGYVTGRAHLNGLECRAILRRAT